MVKNISIILKKQYLNLGKVGTIIKVKKGYAFNYLIPNQIAQIASKGAIKHYEMLKKLELNRIEQNNAKARKIKKKIEAIKKITIRKKVGTDRLIFGSINAKEILQIMEDKHNIKLNKNNINIPNIKQIGIYILNIEIIKNIQVSLQLQIIPQDL